MPITRTLAEAFRFFGATAANPRWAWAAQSEDGKTVVVTMWADKIRREGDAIVYGEARSSNLHIWQNRLGNRDRIKKLQHAQDRCAGLFRTVIVEAVDTEAGTRSTRKKYVADENLVIKLESLNTETGEFVARSMARTKA